MIATGVVRHRWSALTRDGKRRLLYCALTLALPMASARLPAQTTAVTTAQTTRQTAAQVVDLPSRAGATQRLLVLRPDGPPKASVLLFAGGHGGLQIDAAGAIGWGAGNFLVRSRQRFLSHGFQVVVVDAPSDRQSAPFLNGFRQTEEHVADVRAAIAWARQSVAARVPVVLIGTSRGTQSAAFVATRLQGDDGPDLLVLSSTILVDRSSRPVPSMSLDRIAVPVLVAHHEHDGCGVTRYRDIGLLMSRLDAARSVLANFSGGEDRGDACAARSHHGFNGIEDEVVGKIAQWIVAR